MELRFLCLQETGIKRVIEDFSHKFLCANFPLALKFSLSDGYMSLNPTKPLHSHLRYQTSLNMQKGFYGTAEKKCVNLRDENFWPFHSPISPEVQR